MHTNVVVDWIACTLEKRFNHPATMAQYAEGLFPTPAETYVLDKPLHGYRIAIVEPCGVLIMSEGTERMGTHIVLTGGTLDKLANAGFSRQQALSTMVRVGARFSRVDLALDIHDTSLNPVQMYNNLLDGTADTKARSYRLIQGSDGGSTCYIGSPTSEKMIRIYDKAIEQGLRDEKWIRAELQLSGTTANRAVSAIEKNGLIETTKGILRDMVEFPDKSWKQAMLDAGTGIEPSKRKLTNTEQWLMDVVAPVLAKLSLTSDTIELEFYATVEREKRRLEHRRI